MKLCDLSLLQTTAALAFVLPMINSSFAVLPTSLTFIPAYSAFCIKLEHRIDVGWILRDFVSVSPLFSLQLSARLCIVMRFCFTVSLLWGFFIIFVTDFFDLLLVKWCTAGGLNMAPLPERQLLWINAALMWCVNCFNMLLVQFVWGFYVLRWQDNCNNLSNTFTGYICISLMMKQFAYINSNCVFFVLINLSSSS